MEIGDIHLELDGNFKCFLGLLIMISAIPWLELSPERVSVFIVGKKQELEFLLTKKKGIMFLSRINLARFLSLLKI